MDPSEELTNESTTQDPVGTCCKLRMETSTEVDPSIQINTRIASKTKVHLTNCDCKDCRGVPKTTFRQQSALGPTPSMLARRGALTSWLTLPPIYRSTEGWIGCLATGRQKMNR